MVAHAAAAISPVAAEPEPPAAVSLRSPPALNLTPVTGGLIAANLAMHAIRFFLPPGLDRTVLVNLGFAPSLFFDLDGRLAWPDLPITWLSPLSYGFLHGGFLHLLVNTGFLLAFGTLVERRLGGGRFLVFYLATTALATLGTTLVYVVTHAPTLVIGASGGIAGLFGAAARFAFSHPRPRLAAGLPPPRGANRGLILAAIFVGSNLVFGLVDLAQFGGIRTIAWEAHVAGFLAGAALFGPFDRRGGRAGT